MPDTYRALYFYEVLYYNFYGAKMSDILIDKLEETKNKIGNTIFEINELLEITYRDYPKILKNSYTFTEAVKLFVVIQDKAEKLSRYLNEQREVYARLEKTTDKRYDNASVFAVINFLSEYINKKNANIN